MKNAIFERMKHGILLTLLSIISLTVFSQRIDPGKEALNVPLIQMSGGIHVPGGDLSARFGTSGAATVGYFFKNNKNWVYGIDGTIIFGSNVKEDSLLKGIAANYGTETNLLINSQGTLSDIVIFERGFTLMAKAGKIFPFGKLNPNSGIMVQGGVGFMQHKIRYEGDEQDLPHFDAEMKKGYDRMSNGFSTYQFIGYSQLSSNRKVNYFIGLEAYQGFTSNQRAYNYDTRDAGKQNRFDLLIGIKAGWQLPLYKRVPTEFYFD